MTTRRDLLRTLALACGTTCVPVGVLAASGRSGRDVVAQGRLPKDQAEYQEQPKGEQRCADCTHFISDSRRCRIVAGEISPDGWCRLWAKPSG